MQHRINRRWARALVALGVALGLASMSAATVSTPALATDTTYSTSTYTDLTGEQDTLVLMDSGWTATSTKYSGITDNCYVRTATGGMKSHLGVWLFTFKSYNVSCINRAMTKVTYFHWDTPSYHVTSTGQLAGWQWDYWSHNQTRMNDCWVYGTSAGHFVQKYPFIGTIGNATVRQHLDVYCKGAVWS